MRADRRRSPVERLRDAIKEPALGNLSPDSPEFTAAHRRVLQEKFLVRRLFQGFYEMCRELDIRCFGDTAGRRVEIGSGSSFLRECFPDVVTSDIKVLPWLDMVATAERLPFAAGSLRAIYAINVFHHLPDPRAFFRELSVVLRPGGGVILIDPYYNVPSRLLFKRLTASEGFDMDAVSWENDAIAGPMSNANQALSYVVFTRDRGIFEREFPQFEILSDVPHTHLMYLLSGGVNFRQLVPDWCAGSIAAIERALSPFNRWLALQHTIVLRRR